MDSKEFSVKAIQLSAQFAWGSLALFFAILGFTFQTLLACSTKTMTKALRHYAESKTKVTQYCARAWLSFALAISAFFMSSLAAGGPPGYDRKLLPSYPAKSSDCYVLLQSLSVGGTQYVYSSEAPVCKAFVNNFNRFCGEEPQYNRRKIHPESKDLFEPEWTALTGQQATSKAKSIFLSTVLAEQRDEIWQALGNEILTNTEKGQIRLEKAHVAIELAGTPYNVNAYKMQGYQHSDVPGYEQPLLSFESEDLAQGSNIRWQLDNKVQGDLFGFRKGWYLVQFDHGALPRHRRFIVREITRREGDASNPVIARNRCSIQHIKDRQGIN